MNLPTSSLTLEEKASLCTGAPPWRTVGIEREVIQPIVLSDGRHAMFGERESDVLGIDLSNFFKLAPDDADRLSRR